MRQMKDSGIEWIGEIPQDWNFTALKRVAFIQTGNTPSKNRQEIYYSNANGIPWIKADNMGTYRPIVVTAEYLTSAGANEGRIFPPNTVYVCCIASVGKVGYSNITASCNQQINALLFNELYFWKYGYYVTLAQEDEYQVKANGNVVKILNTETQSNLIVPIPTITEQNRIATFLDKKCTEIDNVISKTTASIEEYKKLKQSIITKAVTKGIRGNRPMKDSGIEWIGEIPSDWKTLRGKMLFYEVNNRSNDGDEELLTVSHITGITPRSVKNVNMFMSESLVDYKICEVGDIAANTMWLWQGAIGVSRYRGVISPSYNTYRQRSSVFDSTYLDYMLRIGPLVNVYKTYSTGIVASRLRLYPKDFLSIHFPVPPMQEQVELGGYLNFKCQEIDKIIDRKQQLITELEAYKKSLIYEYVTGKKEVV